MKRQSHKWVAGVSVYCNFLCIRYKKVGCTDDRWERGVYNQMERWVCGWMRGRCLFLSYYIIEGSGANWVVGVFLYFIFLLKGGCTMESRVYGWEMGSWGYVMWELGVLVNLIFYYLVEKVWVYDVMLSVQLEGEGEWWCSWVVKVGGEE